MSAVHIIVGWVGAEHERAKTACGLQGWPSHLGGAKGEVREYDTAAGGSFMASHDARKVTCKRCAK